MRKVFCICCYSYLLTWPHFYSLHNSLLRERLFCACPNSTSVNWKEEDLSLKHNWHRYGEKSLPLQNGSVEVIQPYEKGHKILCTSKIFRALPFHLAWMLNTLTPECNLQHNTAQIPISPNNFNKGVVQQETIRQVHILKAFPVLYFLNLHFYWGGKRTQTEGKQCIRIWTQLYIWS